jgi:DNA-binding CsgD family transcriptional regulator
MLDSIRQGRTVTVLAPKAYEHTAPHTESDALYSAAAALASMGSPALVFDQKRRVLVANQLVEELSSFVRIRSDILSFYDMRAERVFRKAVGDLATRDKPGSVFFVVRCSRGETTAIARVFPIYHRLQAELRPQASMLVFVHLGPPRALPLTVLRSLFGLTPAEARVAGGLATGATVGQLATRASVSRNTVRSQVRGILEKTGCHRQSEAVGLFSRVGLATAFPSTESAG